MSEKKYKIPMFSARATRRMGTGVMGFVMVFILFELFGFEAGKIAVILGVDIFIAVYWYVSRLMKRCSWILQEDCIKEVGIGIKRDIFYEEIAEALRTRKIRIRGNCFQVPKKRGYISFYYEVGNHELQKKIKESYRFLGEKIPAEFPGLTNPVIQQMDRRFFYKKDRRSCIIVMLLSSAAMFLYKLEAVPFMAVGIVGLGQFIQYVMLKSLFKGIYFGKKTEEKIQKSFAKYPEVKVKKVWVTYAQMAAAVICTALLNLFCLVI